MGCVGFLLVCRLVLTFSVYSRWLCRKRWGELDRYECIGIEWWEGGSIQDESLNC